MISLDLSITQRIFIAALISGMLASYILFAFRNYIVGPTITIFSPQNGEKIDQSHITLRGKTSNITHLSLNGRQIYTDQEGNFIEQLLLPVGYTIIEIRAKDRFGRERVKTLHLTRITQN